MSITLRQENTSDYLAVSELIIAAFRDVIYSNHLEQFLVDRLRKSSAFIPELSILAEDGQGEIAGHILLTKIHIQNQGVLYPALALAPLSIKPEFQNKGIGARLVDESHRLARDLGHMFIVVLGHAKYYPRFGYELLSKYHIQVPIQIPDESAMIISLAGNDLSTIKGGMVKYSEEFF